MYPVVLDLLQLCMQMFLNWICMLSAIAAVDLSVSSALVGPIHVCVRKGQLYPPLALGVEPATTSPHPLNLRFLVSEPSAQQAQQAQPSALGDRLVVVCSLLCMLPLRIRIAVDTNKDSTATQQGQYSTVQHTTRNSTTAHKDHSWRSTQRRLARKERPPTMAPGARTTTIQRIQITLHSNNVIRDKDHLSQDQTSIYIIHYTPLQPRKT